ncbi:GSCOCG00008828001-RA-CDS [Cotesia congregata]|nr:GSCOCG00008828001-RA-CDS [Cotesia congregata]
MKMISALMMEAPEILSNFKCTILKYSLELHRVKNIFQLPRNIFRYDLFYLFYKYKYYYLFIIFYLTDKIKMTHWFLMLTKFNVTNLKITCINNVEAIGSYEEKNLYCEL